jgi:hypothetical protein
MNTVQARQMSENGNETDCCDDSSIQQTAQYLPEMVNSRLRNEASLLPIAALNPTDFEYVSVYMHRVVRQPGWWLIPLYLLSSTKDINLQKTPIANLVSADEYKEKLTESIRLSCENRASIDAVSFVNTTSRL